MSCFPIQECRLSYFVRHTQLGISVGLNNHDRRALRPDRRSFLEKKTDRFTDVDSTRNASQDVTQTIWFSSGLVLIVCQTTTMGYVLDTFVLFSCITLLQTNMPLVCRRNLSFRVPFSGSMLASGSAIITSLLFTCSFGGKGRMQ